jgi:peroxiredoxin
MQSHLKSTAFIFFLMIGSFESAHADQATDFTLPDTQGTEVSLRQFKGRVVYLDFWASWCSPCIDSFPWMEKMQQKYRDQGVVFLAVNVDRKRQDAEKFLSAHPVSFPVVYDSKGTVAKAYKLQGMPSALLIDGSGNIRHSHIGFNRKDSNDYELHIRQVLDLPE